MASYDTEFSGVGPDLKGSPELDAEPRGRGCLFYGCVVAIVAAVLLALVALVLHRVAVRCCELYTAAEPVPLPTLSLSGASREAAVERMKAFRDAVEQGRDVEPLTLTGDDLNALVEEAPELKGRVFLALEGDHVRAWVSLPLREIRDISLTRGRYLNGEAEVKLVVQDGRLDLQILSMTADGKVVPEILRDMLDQSGVFFDDDDDETNDSEIERRIKRVFRRIESLEVQEGVMIITPRSAVPRETPASRLEPSPSTP